MSETYTKLTVTTDRDHLELVSAIMSMLDPGLMIEDYSDFSLDGMYGALVDETILNADKNVARVSLFLPAGVHVAEYRAFLDERFAAAGIAPEISTEGLREEDYAESWKQYYKPVPLGRVTVVPAWMEYSPRPDEIVLRMDPGMAFGTGTHETTRLVLRFLEDELKGGERLLDVGTGSGILSICASKLGAKSCHAYDIDPDAVRVARENAIADGCDNIVVGRSDLLRDVDLSGGKFDFCVANLVADILLLLLPDLSRVLKRGAPAILSGIINLRAEDVKKKAVECGFTVERELVENDWVSYLIREV